MNVTPAERALLSKPSWTADELVRIAFIARRLAGVDVCHPGHSNDCLDAYPLPCVCGVGDEPGRYGP